MEIRGSEVNGTSRAIELQWSDGCTLHYPFAWLRDNCQCKDCFHTASLNRSFLMRTLDPQIEPAKAEMEDGKQLSVTWPDGHHGDYTPDWLYKRGFRTDEPLQSLKHVDKKPFKCWGSELQDNVPVAKFDEILTDDSALYQWITHLEETGLCLVQGVPTETGQIQRLGSQVTHLLPTTFGLINQVKAKPGTISTIAYSMEELGLHFDFAAMEGMPGVQLLHCIAQTSSPGGVNTLTDVSNVANQMKRDYPDMYKLLSTVPVYHCEIGTDCYGQLYLVSKSPVIKLDQNGELETIHWSGQTRESRQNHLPLNVMQPLYDAFCRFDQLIHHTDNCISLKMKPGDMLCFDNHRVAHGRTAFSVKDGDERHLEGSYMTWDGLLSTRRVLQARLEGIDFKYY